MMPSRMFGIVVAASFALVVIAVAALAPHTCTTTHCMRVR